MSSLKRVFLPPPLYRKFPGKTWMLQGGGGKLQSSKRLKFASLYLHLLRSKVAVTLMVLWFFLHYFSGKKNYVFFCFLNLDKCTSNFFFSRVTKKIEVFRGKRARCLSGSLFSLHTSLPRSLALNVACRIWRHLLLSLSLCLPSFLLLLFSAGLPRGLGNIHSSAGCIVDC